MQNFDDRRRCKWEVWEVWLLLDPNRSQKVLKWFKCETEKNKISCSIFLLSFLSSICLSSTFEQSKTCKREISVEKNSRFCRQITFSHRKTSKNLNFWKTLFLETNEILLLRKCRDKVRGKSRPPRPKNRKTDRRKRKNRPRSSPRIRTTFLLRSDPLKRAKDRVPASKWSVRHPTTTTMWPWPRGTRSTTLSRWTNYNNSSP